MVDVYTKNDRYRKMFQLLITSRSSKVKPKVSSVETFEEIDF